MQNIKVIGFDLDQTLYPKSSEIDNAIQQYLYKKISEHLNIDLKDAEDKFTKLYCGGNGLSGRKTLEYLKIPNADGLVQEALEKADISKFLSPDPEVISLLSDLKNRYKYLDIITGSNRSITLAKLEKLSINSDLFNHIITSEDASKNSDAEAYCLWLKKYTGIKPEEFLYIGDRPSSDFDQPNTLGIKTILVNQKLVNEKINCIQLKSFKEIKSLLLK